jgi:hypothetical protein
VDAVRGRRKEIRGYPEIRIHEVGRRGCARLIDGGRARARALAYGNNGFGVASITTVKVVTLCIARVSSREE